MNITTHRVYWTENNEPNSKDFSSNEILNALNFCEKLRNDRDVGKAISFISIASEVEECTSLSGVAAVKLDYNWTKRRGGRR